MLKALFKKTPATKTEYRQAREANTNTFHIQRSEGHPLCGSRKVMKSGWAVTVEEVASSATTQHSGFVWCAGCGAGFTGKEKAVFTATRFRVSANS